MQRAFSSHADVAAQRARGSAPPKASPARRLAIPCSLNTPKPSVSSAFLAIPSPTSRLPRSTMHTPAASLCSMSSRSRVVTVHASQQVCDSARGHGGAVLCRGACRRKNCWSSVSLASASHACVWRQAASGVADRRGLRAQRVYHPSWLPPPAVHPLEHSCRQPDSHACPLPPLFPFPVVAAIPPRHTCTR